MIHVNIQEAQTHLSSYLEQVENGEVVILCRENQPVAELRAIQASGLHGTRVAGLLKGMVQFEPGVFASMSEEELADFESMPLRP